MNDIKTIAAALAAYEAENNSKAAIAENDAILQAFNALKAKMFAFARDYCKARGERAAAEKDYTFAMVADETLLEVEEDEGAEDAVAIVPTWIAKQNEIIEAYNAITQQLTTASFPESAVAWPIIIPSILPNVVSPSVSSHVDTSSSKTNVLLWPNMHSTPVVYGGKDELMAALQSADVPVSLLPVWSMTSMMSEGDSNPLPVAPNSLNVLHNTNIPSRLEVIAAACQTNTEMVQEILADHIGGTTVSSAEVVLPEPESVSSNSIDNILITPPPSVELKFTMTDNTVVNTYTPTYSGATTVTAAQGSKSIEQIAADMAEAYYQSKWLEHADKSPSVFKEWVAAQVEPVSSRNPQLQHLLLAALKAKGFERFYPLAPMRTTYGMGSSYNSGSNGSLLYSRRSPTMSSYLPPAEGHNNGSSLSQRLVSPVSQGVGNNGLTTFTVPVTIVTSSK